MKSSASWKFLVPALVVSVAIAIGAGLFIGYKTAPKVVVANASPPPVPTRAELLRLVNAERAKYGVAPLKEDWKLDTSAEQKANDEVSRNYYGHFYDGQFVGQQFIDAVGITCILDDENLDENNTAQEAMTAWMSSPAHRAAILNPSYTLTGFGIVYRPYQYPVYDFVEHFCEP